MNTLKEKTGLYRHYDLNGVVLYIGISHTPLSRFKSHQIDKEWCYDSVRMDIEWFDTRSEALLAEKLAIINDQPLYNKTHLRVSKDPIKRFPLLCLIFYC